MAMWINNIIYTIYLYLTIGHWVTLILALYNFFSTMSIIFMRGEKILFETNINF